MMRGRDQRDSVSECIRGNEGKSGIQGCPPSGLLVWRTGWLVMPPEEMQSAGRGADVEGMVPTVIGPAQGRWHFVNAGMSRNSTE